MRELDELTDLVSLLNDAATFCETADRLISWAQRVTGGETVVLRLNQRGENGSTWIPVCRQTGADDAFARDEALVSADECICGRVSTGTADTSLPFFTPYGSFVWGHVATIGAHFTPDQLGPLRGRCISEGFLSLAVVPLAGPQGPLGCLHLADHRPDQFDGSIELLEAACRLAGQILVRHHRHERERAAFEAIQGALMPAQAPVVSGLDLGVCFGSATDIALIGGDFYDVVDRGAAGCVLFVGDYSGHGIEAAGMAARARYALAGAARRAAGPGDLLGEANDLLAGLLPEDRFVSVAVLMIDHARKHVRVALAGHPAPLRLRGDALTEIDAPHNTPLGLSPGTRFAEAEIGLKRTDILILITDGIIESRRDGRLFGLEGIHAVWLADGPADMQALSRAVCQASESYHDSVFHSDDRLALAVRPTRAGDRMRGAT